MEIKIIDVTSTTKPTAKGSYIELNVSFRDLGTGRVSGKKIMSFTNKEVFEVLAQAKKDDEFTVKAEKDGNFWQWTAITKGVSGATGANKPATAGSPGHTAPRSNFETPEERAQRQVYIIRQSSLSNAIATLTVGAKATPKTEAILELAEKYTQFVFGKTADVSDTVQQDLLNFRTLSEDIPN
ncbi:MAG: hypothetical protein KGI54_15425 [Pseudomonadota bacterium]|nr:hypothetical protein [Pseudomonadota bacterium]